MRGRLAGAVVATFVVAAAAQVVVAAPAQAAAYRYWSYWHDAGDSWQWSRVGATGHRPDDGSVEGWRFAVSVDAPSATRPRSTAGSAFATLCGGTPAQSGKKRVALVVDFGVEADAPSGEAPPAQPLRGECVVVATRATGMDVLGTAGYPVRGDSGMVCGLSGYPRRGCGEFVDDPRPAPTTAPTALPAPGSGTGADGSGGGTGKPRPTPGSTGTGGDRDDAGAGRPTPSASPSTAATATGSAGPAARATPTDAQSAPAADDAAPTLVAGAPTSGDGGRSPLPFVVGAAVITAIGSAAALRARRQRRPQ